MWNASSYLNKLAEKAQQAAATVEAQLNDSVGANVHSNVSSLHEGCPSEQVENTDSFLDEFNGASKLSNGDQEGWDEEEEFDFDEDRVEEQEENELHVEAMPTPTVLELSSDTKENPTREKKTYSQEIEALSHVDASETLDDTIAEDDETLFNEANKQSEPVPLSNIHNDTNESSSNNNTEPMIEVNDAERYGDKDHNTSDINSRSVPHNDNPDTGDPVSDKQDHVLSDTATNTNYFTKEDIEESGEEKQYDQSDLSNSLTYLNNSNDVLAYSPIKKSGSMDGNEIIHSSFVADVTYEHSNKNAQLNTEVLSLDNEIDAAGNEKYENLLSTLKMMGFSTDQINYAIQQCGEQSEAEEVIAFMLANQNGKKDETLTKEMFDSRSILETGTQMETEMIDTGDHKEECFEYNLNSDVVVKESFESNPTSEISTKIDTDVINAGNHEEEVPFESNLISEMDTQLEKKISSGIDTKLDTDVNETKACEDNLQERLSNITIEGEVSVGFVADQIGEVAAQLLSPKSQVAMHDAIEAERRLQEKSLVIEELRRQLSIRENQLEQRATENAALHEQYEAEINGLKTKVDETKNEAKRRILRAKDRVDEMQKKLKNVSSISQDTIEKDEIIAALREEGAALAQNQSKLEQSIKSSRRELREIKGNLEDQIEINGTLEGKVKALNEELKLKSSDLVEAKQALNRVPVLEDELQSKTEELNKCKAIQRNLTEEIGSLKSDLMQTKDETEKTRNGLIIEGEKEKDDLKNEIDIVRKEFESKLRTTEKEANLREDALRHELGELRKRWQDAVRRADSLTIDVRESTAPLMRQLDASERQNRVRAAAWAEIESKLRNDLEDMTITNEKLTREANEAKAASAKHERVLATKEKAYKELKDKTEVLEQENDVVKHSLADTESKLKDLLHGNSLMQKQTTEAVLRTKTEMMKLVVESEEKYQMELDRIQMNLKKEQERSSELEIEVKKLKEIIRKNENYETPSEQDRIQGEVVVHQDQTGILLNTLAGLEEGPENDRSESLVASSTLSTGSFAAMEKLSQLLQISKKELDSLKVS